MPFLGHLKPKDKICKGTGVYEGEGCGGFCRTQYNGLCKKCLNIQKMEATYDFAKVSPDQIKQIKSIVRQIKGGWNRIAYKLYLMDMNIPVALCSQEEFLENKKLVLSYKERIERALDYEERPKGTKHTPMIFTIVFRLSGGANLKKKNYERSISRIVKKGKKDGTRDIRVFQALGNMSELLSDKAKTGDNGLLD